MDKPSFVLIPKDVVKFEEYSNLIRGEIIIHNTGNLPLMFKIKTNSKERFSVRPSFELIEPNTKRKIFILVAPEQVVHFINDCRQQQNSNEKSTVFLLQYYSLASEKWDELKPLMETSGQSKESSAVFLNQLKMMWDETNNKPDRSLLSAKSRLGVHLAIDDMVIDRLLAQTSNQSRTDPTAQSSPGGRSYSTALRGTDNLLRNNNSNNNVRPHPSVPETTVDDAIDTTAASINPRLPSMDDPTVKPPRTAINASSVSANATVGRRYNGNGNISDSSAAYDTTNEYVTDNNRNDPYGSGTRTNNNGIINNASSVPSNTGIPPDSVLITQKDLQEFITIRDQYKTMANNFVRLTSERNELSNAVTNREMEIERYRKERIEMESQLKDGLRKRNTGGTKGINNGNDDDDGDNLQNNDNETNPPGFPLWQVLLLAFIMFLLGRLTVDIL